MRLFIMQKETNPNLRHFDTELLLQEAGNVWGQASAGSLTVNSYCDHSVSQNC